MSLLKELEFKKKKDRVYKYFVPNGTMSVAQFC